VAPSLAATFAAAAVEATLRTLLAADPATRAELAALAGRRLDIELRGGPARLSLVFTAEGLRVEADAETRADASARLTPAGLVDLLAGDQERAVMAGAVRIDGDRELVTSVFAVLSRFRPDLEGPLARVFGEAPTAAAGVAARRSGQEMRRFARGGAKAVRGLLTSEQGPLPSRPEVMRFLDEVDDVRLAVDRLEARMAQLRTRLERAEDPAA
jgi:ubiquinone biosynthesis protein UbiJ